MQDNINEDSLEALYTELKNMEKTKSEGAIIRSRAKYAVEGEKRTAFFLNLEKIKQEQCYI